MNDDEVRRIHLEEQADAARRELKLAMVAYAESRGGNIHAGLGSPWLQTLAHTTDRMLQDGTARRCRHVGNSPRVVHTAAWALGTVACEQCAPRMLRTRLLDRSTCDRCRQVSPGGVVMGVMGHGTVLMAFGVCESCADLLYREGAAGGPAGDTST